MLIVMDGTREYSKSIPDEEIIEDAIELFKEVEDFEKTDDRDSE